MFFKLNRFMSLLLILLFVAGAFMLSTYDAARFVGDLAVFKNAQPRSWLTPVIDPGHGGADGGAVSISGVFESEINLSISLKVEAIMNLFGLSPIMTRNTNELEYPEDANTIKSMKTFDQKRRVAVINSIENAVLISVHQNKYTSRGPSGAQIFYAGGMYKELNHEFALLAQETLRLALDPENNRAVKQISDSNYIMKRAACPALLIECGFLSNPLEDTLLQTRDYQLKVASAITSAYLCSADLISASLAG